MIQKIYLHDAETALLFCLGVTKGDQWEPLRIQGKVGYAYRSEVDAQKICAGQSHSAPTASMRYQQTRKVLLGRAAIGLLHTIWGT